MKTAIVTDSNSGITQAEAQKMNVFVQCLLYLKFIFTICFS